MRKLAILATVIAIGLVLAACGGGAPPEQKTPTVPTTPTAPAAPEKQVTPTPPAPKIDAKALFATNCAACHGQNREGVAGLGPALTPTSLASKSLDSIQQRITEGKSGTAMLGFGAKLKHDEIDALANFIKTIAP